LLVICATPYSSRSSRYSAIKSPFSSIIGPISLRKSAASLADQPPPKSPTNIRHSCRGHPTSCLR
jgi:hypothetical protein